MKHVLFAEFRDDTTAHQALGELSTVGVRPSNANINLHPAGAAPEDNQERPLVETDTRRGIALGLFFAALIGPLMGWLVTGPLHLFEAGIGTGIATGIVLGLAIGFVGGAITGAMNPEHKLEQIERRAATKGGVVATVEVSDASQEDSVRRVFVAHGARVESRTL